MVTIPRNNGPIPPPRKPSSVSPFVGPAQKINTTRDPVVHEIMAEAVDHAHEADVIGIAVIMFDATGEMVIRFHSTPASTPQLNLALDKLKAVIVSKGVG